VASGSDLVDLLNELLDNGVGRVGSIRELHVDHLDSVGFELIVSIHTFVESDDALHLVGAEVVQVLFGFESLSVAHTTGRTEGEYFGRENPTDVALV
jgi:hypothetical protein